jgi:hypothetical protein
LAAWPEGTLPDDGIDELDVSTNPIVGALARLAEDPSFIDLTIWEAQAQIIFPIVERSRRRFIEQYGDELQSVLPQLDDFNKELIYPKDMELRHMWYYYFKSAGFRNKDDDRVFKLLYNARNDLAHLELLDSTLLLEILSLE